MLQLQTYLITDGWSTTTLSWWQLGRNNEILLPSNFALLGASVCSKCWHHLHPHGGDNRDDVACWHATMMWHANVADKVRCQGKVTALWCVRIGQCGKRHGSSEYSGDCVALWLTGWITIRLHVESNQLGWPTRDSLVYDCILISMGGCLISLNPFPHDRLEVALCSFGLWQVYIFFSRKKLS